MERMNQSEELADKGMFGANLISAASRQAARASQAVLARGCVCAYEGVIKNSLPG